VCPIRSAVGSNLRLDDGLGFHPMGYVSDYFRRSHIPLEKVFRLGRYIQRQPPHCGDDQFKFASLLLCLGVPDAGRLS
jgi:hypothetical protein